MSTPSFDSAIELLEITDIDNMSLQDLQKQVKAIKRRWHPDRVSHLQDEAQIERFTSNFQMIEPAAALIESYLKGEYQIGEKFSNEENVITQEPHEIIRENASNMLFKLKEVWPMVKEKKYKLNIEEVVLSDGFILKELLKEDFKEDLASLALISFWMYNSTIGILTILTLIFFPTIGQLGMIFWLVHIICCLIAFLPLSRFWLPNPLKPVVAWFVDLGLNLHDIVANIFPNNLFVQLSLMFTRGLAKLVKYLFLFPLYEIAKVAVGNQVVGKVKKQIHYYADTADWFIDDILKKVPDSLSEEELYALSHLYSNLIDVKVEYA